MPMSTAHAASVTLIKTALDTNWPLPTNTKLAEAIVKAIENTVAAAMVTIPPGTVVTVPGSPTTTGVVNPAPIPLQGAVS